MKSILFIWMVLICGWAHGQSEDASDQTDAQIDEASTTEAQTNQPPEEDNGVLPPEIEAILDSQSSYDEMKKCIPRSRIRTVKVLDEHHVSFQVGREEFYLVQMEARCHGLRRNGTISYETTSSTNLCEWDSIRPLYEFGPGNYQLGSTCRIPGFIPITKEQLSHLQEELKVR
jgi:hypothetical protein